MGREARANKNVTRYKASTLRKDMKAVGTMNLRPRYNWYSRFIPSLGKHMGTMHKLGGFLLVYKNKKRGL